MSPREGPLVVHCVLQLCLIVFIGKCVIISCEYHVEKNTWDKSSLKDRSVIGLFCLNLTLFYYFLFCERKKLRFSVHLI